MNIRNIILALVFNGCSFLLHAQMMTNNNILITVAGSAQVTVKGDILNTAGTTITNDATIELTGDWINNSGNNCFGTSQGNVMLNGVNQYIGGTSQTVFNNLNLINGIKTLQIGTTTGGGNLIPAGVLNCSNAVLDLNSNTLTVNNPNGAAISNTTGYILSEDFDNSSKITWKIGATAGIHVVPFGNAGAVQIPYSLNITSGNIGDVTVSTYKTISNNTPYPTLPLLVTHVKNVTGADNSANTVDRFWQVDKTGMGTASYTFTYAALENAANGNTSLKAQCWNNAILGWETALVGQTNPTTQSVTVPGVIKSGAWALALLSSPLPVELLTFSAAAVGNSTVNCKWSTASEKNNDYYTVMRSKDGISFEEVGIVEGAGNSNVVLAYSYSDNKPFHGVSYYRLKQTDINGDISYSKTESVLITEKETQYAVYPNPSNGSFFIQYTIDEVTRSTYSITDATGRIIALGALNDLSGVQQISLPQVAKGFYFLRIAQAEKIQFKKLEVIK